MPKYKDAALDNDQIRLLASYGCTNEEIAHVARVSVRTLYRRFKAPIDDGRIDLCISIRRLQYLKAVDGNVAMLIWLGKQYLGQRDKHDQMINSKSDIVIDLSLPPDGAALVADDDAEPMLVAD